MHTQIKILLRLISLLLITGFTSVPFNQPNSNIYLSKNELTGNTYYVSTTGNDKNPGTIDLPWRTPEKAGSAAQAGDTIFFRGGVYYGQLTPKNSGNSTDGWITFKAYPGEEPTIIYDAYWGRAININEVNFVEINGFTAVAAGENGPGIGIKNAHHIKILNCVARDSAGAGINTNYGIDYITIEGNRVYGNANRNQYSGSAISIWWSGGPTYDNEPGYHIIIQNNLIYDNRNVFQENLTDGNGIILDNNDLGGTPDKQSPQILVANNVIFHNGGRCIHVLNTSNVDIVHNTCYHNVETNQISNGCNGEISLQRTYSYTSAVNINVFNNVAFGKGGTCNGGREQAFVFQVWCIQSGCPQYTSDYNIWFNGAIEQLGPHDIIADPKFWYPSIDPSVANFSLKPDSPAIDTGSDLFASVVKKDFLGVSRPWGEGFDRGAYEYVEKQNFFLPFIIAEFFSNDLHAMTGLAADHSIGAYCGRIRFICSLFPRRTVLVTISGGS